MSKIDFSALNTPEGYKSFLQAYHTELSSQRSFPPLGLQKALHTAAPIFGYNDWNVMSAALQQAPDGEFDHPDRYTLKNGNTHFEYVLSERYDALLSAHKQLLAGGAELAPADKEPEKIHVISIVISEIDADTDEVSHSDTELARSWEKAKDKIADLALKKAWGSDSAIDDIMDCRHIRLPDADDIEDFDDMEVSNLMDWVIENNDIIQLITLVEHLDSMTKITISEHWL